ncbi:MAG TPA: hypothetical protein DFH99_00895 [Roseburia sp.]|nr:hypothetical protein [Roseburia sp.]
MKKITNLRNSFILLSLMALPPIFGVTGVWLAIPVAEFITMSDPCPARHSPAQRPSSQGMPEYLFSSQYR